MDGNNMIALATSNMPSVDKVYKKDNIFKYFKKTNEKSKAYKLFGLKKEDD